MSYKIPADNDFWSIFFRKKIFLVNYQKWPLFNLNFGYLNFEIAKSCSLVKLNGNIKI